MIPLARSEGARERIRAQAEAMASVELRAAVPSQM